MRKKAAATCRTAAATLPHLCWLCEVNYRRPHSPNAKATTVYAQTRGEEVSVWREYTINPAGHGKVCQQPRVARPRLFNWRSHKCATEANKSAATAPVQLEPSYDTGTYICRVWVARIYDPRVECILHQKTIMEKKFGDIGSERLL